MRAFFQDWDFTPNHVAWFLVLVALLLGGILALQTNDSAAISELRNSIARNEGNVDRNRDSIDKLKLELENLKRSTENYQAEQRQNVLNFSQALKRIEIEQAKSGARK